MNILSISDIHGTSRVPRNRIGDPLEDFEEKIDFIFNLSKQMDNSPIVSSGDLFDTPRDIVALYSFLKIRRRYPKTKFFAIYGQHDMYFRNIDSVTCLLLLEKSGQITMLGKKPYKLTEKIHLYGSSWNKAIPKIVDHEALNILSIHAPIYTDPLFPDHSFINVKEWKKSKGFRFIICGDIHRTFIHKTKSSIICNTGPLMRLENSNYMMEHVPKVFCYSTSKHKLKSINIPCKPSKEVLKKLKTSIQSNTNQNEESEISEAFTLPISKTKNVIQIINELIKKSNNRKAIRQNFSKVIGDKYNAYMNMNVLKRKK